MLKNLLMKKGITMYKLSKLTGLGQSTINELCNKKGKNIRLETAAKISKVLNVSIDEIYKNIK